MKRLRVGAGARNRLDDDENGRFNYDKIVLEAFELWQLCRRPDKGRRQPPPQRELRRRRLQHEPCLAASRRRNYIEIASGLNQKESASWRWPCQAAGHALQRALRERPWEVEVAGTP